MAAGWGDSGYGAYFWGDLPGYTSVFPEEIDSLAPEDLSDDPSLRHTLSHSALTAAVLAIQETLGVDVNGGESDLAARLTAIEALL